MLNLVSNWDTQMAALLSSQTLILTFYFTEFLDISPATTITTSGFFEARYIELCLVHLKPHNWNQMRHNHRSQTVVLDAVCGMTQAPMGGWGAITKKEVTWSYAWINPSYGYFILLAHTNVNVDGKVMCMHRGKKTLWSVMTAPLSPWQHSNDRLTFPAQNMMARNRALQSHCPECSK